MQITQRTTENTAIVLIDYVVGFANYFRSQSVADNLNGALALAKIGLGWNIPILATIGPKGDPRGPLYPQLAALLREDQIIHKGGQFDAFDDPGFAAAMENLKGRHLAIAGLMTEGCVLQTTLGALRRGYTVSIVVDATAGESSLTHDAALQRLIQLGVTPTSWQSLASEILGTWDNVQMAGVFRDVRLAHATGIGLGMQATAAAMAVGKAAAGAG
jgi:nicotinamidase-related amidase